MAAPALLGTGSRRHDGWDESCRGYSGFLVLCPSAEKRDCRAYRFGAFIINRPRVRTYFMPFPDFGSDYKVSRLEQFHKMLESARFLSDVACRLFLTARD